MGNNETSNNPELSAARASLADSMERWESGNWRRVGMMHFDSSPDSLPNSTVNAAIRDTFPINAAELPVNPLVVDATAIDSFEAGYQAMLTHREATYNYYRGSDEQVAARRELIHSYTEQTAKFAVSDVQADAIRAAGNLAEYRLCARIGDPLPDDVYIHGDVLASGILRTDGSIIKHATSLPDDILRDISTSTNAEGTTPAIQYIDAGLGELYEATILHHPFIQQCLAAEQGAARTDKRTLRANEKLPLRVALHDRARRENGFAADVPLHSYDPAVQPVLRTLTFGELEIDEQTVRDKQAPTQNTDTLINFVLNYLNQGKPKGTGYSPHDPDGFLYISQDGTKQELKNYYDVHRALNRKLQETLRDDEFDMTYIIADTIMATTAGDYQNLREGIKSSRRLDEDDIASPVLKIGKKMPTGYHGDYRTVTDPAIGHSSVFELLHSQADASYQLLQVDKQDQPPIRLLYGTTSVPTGRQSADMIIRDESPRHDPEAEKYHRVSEVLGYTALSAYVASDGLRIAYARTEVDPYRECETVIDSSKLAVMRAYLESFDETAINQALTKETSLSVTDLAKLLAEHTEYPAPKQRSSFDNLASTPRNDAGQLQLQCSGASKLFVPLLNAAWPGCAQSIVGGTLKMNQREQPSTSHAQTLFVDPHTGERYILDSTPSMSSEARKFQAKYAKAVGIDMPPIHSSNDIRQSLKTAFRLQRRHRRIGAPAVEATRIQALDTTALEQVVETRRWPTDLEIIKDLSEAQRAKHNTKLYEDMVTFCMSLYGTSDRATFFKKHAPWTKRTRLDAVQFNPVRATLEALKSDSPELHQRTLAYVDSYTERYRKAPRYMIDRFGLRNHSSAELDALSTALRNKII